MNLTQKLRQLHADIVEAKDGFKIVDAWALADRLLSRMPVDQTKLKEIVADKDADGLDDLIDQLENPAPPKSQPLPDFSDGDLDAAMRAFKKRLKVMILSDESRLGGRYTTGGRQSKIDAIEPPTGFDAKIWKALAAGGRLTDTGGGFYSLPKS